MRKLTLLAFFIVAACGDDPKRPPISESPPGPVNPIGGGGTSTDAGTNDALDAGDAGVCTDLPITGVVVQERVVPGDPVAGTGGALVDGIYDLTEALFYGGSAIPGVSGATYQGSVRITGGVTIERHIIYKTSGGATSESSVRGTFAAGPPATLTISCPFATQEAVTHTAGPSNLSFTNLVTKESWGFTKRP